MNKIILPKPHLSWSQMDIWEHNPERYKREYFENAKKLDTRFLQFGKGIAQTVEELCELQTKLGSKKLALKELVKTKKLDYDTESVLRELETDGISEYKIECEIEGVPILSYVDKYRDWENEFREYKSGKHPWDQAKVQKHGQLLFYAVGLRKKIGKMPDGCWLDWIETAESSGEKEDFWVANKKLALTGKIKSFRRTFDERELEKMEARIVKVAEEISVAYQKWIEENI